MKKIMMLALGLGLALGSSFAAQDDKKVDDKKMDDSTKTKKHGKHGKKKGKTDKMDTPATPPAAK